MGRCRRSWFGLSRPHWWWCHRKADLGYHNIWVWMPSFCYSSSFQVILVREIRLFLNFIFCFCCYWHHCVHCFLFFCQSSYSRLEGSLTSYLASMEYKSKAQEAHRCPFSLVDSSQSTCFLSALQSLFMIACWIFSRVFCWI